MPTQAWELAHEAAARAGVGLRPLTSLEDAEDIVRVMIATWGEYQIVPREMIRALAHSGNVPWGADREGELVGYVLGWAGVDDGGLHVHSHMLAVVPDLRHAGVGFALKLAQRALALEQRIDVVRWTFDPMVARNAWFNFGKLGVVGDRFHRAFYGEMNDELNRGERTDRFMVRWDLAREPGTRPLGRSLATIVRREGDTATPRPAGGAAPSEGGLVEIPRAWRELREADPALAEAWRDATAGAFETALGAGLTAVGFDRERCAYVLGEDPGSGA